MDTLSAFARGSANRGNPQKVFDWDKAARLIVERGITSAEAGLSMDLEYTCGPILRDGQIDMDGYTYLSSNWAIPVLVVDGDEIECYCGEESGWDEHTKWPESSRCILLAGGVLK